MISIIIYGRNDSYGYNLHKRAALSINCMAEVLSSPDDEILFVDYNTQDDFPTFPEAIRDTLTDKAKRHLRIFRLRPEVHARFPTYLMTLEPVARNVALRRSNPKNRWILSTNTDMIFVPRSKKSLTEIVQDLPKGHYCIPRFEIPETLWESLDRMDPAGTIESAASWGWNLYLNEAVTGMEIIKFDAPGDFQLMERADLLAIHGFDEGMLQGWHVDSNIAKRIGMLAGEVRDLSEEIFGYHCNHTRQVTTLHRRDSTQNDMDRFIHDLTDAHLPEQSEGWGCPNDSIEEIRLDRHVLEQYMQALQPLTAAPLQKVLHSAYVTEFFNKVGYVPEHVLPFLIDIFTALPRSYSARWYGVPGRMAELFRNAWRELGFLGDFSLVDQGTLEPDTSSTPDVLFFNFARSDGSALLYNEDEEDRQITAYLVCGFWNEVLIEQARLAQGMKPRRFVGINVINNSFESLFSSQVNTAKTSFISHIRHGFLDAPDYDSVSDWLPDMQVGAGSERVGHEIRAPQGMDGHVAFGPYAKLPFGRYVAYVEIGLNESTGSLLNATDAEVNLELALGDKVLAEKRVRGQEIFSSPHVFLLDVLPSSVDVIENFIHSYGFEFRVWTNGVVPISLRQVNLRRIPFE